MVQWDECDLSECPPYRLKGSMTAMVSFLPTNTKNYLRHLQIQMVVNIR